MKEFLQARPELSTPEDEESLICHLSRPPSYSSPYTDTRGNLVMSEEMQSIKAHTTSSASPTPLDRANDRANDSEASWRTLGHCGQCVIYLGYGTVFQLYSLLTYYIASVYTSPVSKRPWLVEPDATMCIGILIGHVVGLLLGMVLLSDCCFVSLTAQQLVIYETYFELCLLYAAFVLAANIYSFSLIEAAPRPVFISSVNAILFILPLLFSIRFSSRRAASGSGRQAGG